MTQTQTKTVQTFLTSLKIVPIAMIVGPLFMLLAVLAMQADQLIFDYESVELTYVLVLVAMLPGLIFGGNFIFQQQTQAAINSDSLGKKTNAYFVANIIKGAMLEGGVILSIVFIFLTANLVFLMFWFLIVIVQVGSLPSKQKMIQTMQFTKSEIDQLENPNTVLS